jgi:SAM-dependent methyltransferase
MKTIDERLTGRLRCPACAAALSMDPGRAACAGCGASYPVVRGVPVLIDESKSLFRIAGAVASAESSPGTRTWQDAARDLLQDIAGMNGVNLSGQEMLGHLAGLLREESEAPRVLILGGASLGVGVDLLVHDPAISAVESDIVFGPRTNLVCDAHRIPFEDATFDAVVAQAVLEYVFDPFRVVDEIHRVLRPRGFVYAESPFMQQVHGGAYDFFRFTHVGHRRVFQRFEEVDSGVAGGPAMALRWSYRYLLRSFTRNAAARALADTFALATTRWLSRYDRRLKDSPGAYDAASAFYFLGRRSETAIPAQDVVASYRGAWKMHR